MIKFFNVSMRSRDPGKRGRAGGAKLLAFFAIAAAAFPMVFGGGSLGAGEPSSQTLPNVQIVQTSDAADTAALAARGMEPSMPETSLDAQSAASQLIHERDERNRMAYENVILQKREASARASSLPRANDRVPMRPLSQPIPVRFSGDDILQGGYPRSR